MNSLQIYQSILQKCLRHPDCPKKSILEEHLTEKSLDYSNYIVHLNRAEIEVLEGIWQELELTDDELNQLDFKKPLTHEEKQAEVFNLKYDRVFYDLDDEVMKVVFADGIVTSLEDAEEYRDTITSQGIILSDNRRYEVSFPEPQYRSYQTQIKINNHYYPNLGPDTEAPEVVGLWGAYHDESRLEEALQVLASYALVLGYESLHFQILNITDSQTPYDRKIYGFLTYNEVIDSLCQDSMCEIQELLPQPEVNLDSEYQGELLKLLQYWWQNNLYVRRLT